MSFVLAHSPGGSVNYWPTFWCPLCVWEALFSILKLTLSGIKFTNEIVRWTSVLFVSLNPLGITPQSFQPLICLSFSLWQSKTTTGAETAGWPILIHDSGTRVLIKEWDFLMRTLHNLKTVFTTSINFPVVWESHNRPGGLLSLSLEQSSYVMSSLFIPTNSIKTAELRKNIKSASCLTLHHMPLSLLQLKKT